MIGPSSSGRGFALCEVRPTGPVIAARHLPARRCGPCRPVLTGGHRVARGRWGPPPLTEVSSAGGQPSLSPSSGSADDRPLPSWRPSWDGQRSGSGQPDEARGLRLPSCIDGGRPGRHGRRAAGSAAPTRLARPTHGWSGRPWPLTPSRSTQHRLGIVDGHLKMCDAATPPTASSPASTPCRANLTMESPPRPALTDWVEPPRRRPPPARRSATPVVTRPGWRCPPACRPRPVGDRLRPIRCHARSRRRTATGPGRPGGATDIPRVTRG